MESSTGPTTRPTTRPKRFWKTASVGPKGETGYPILLDGRGARTPAGSKLAAPSEALAMALAEEWSAVGDEMDSSAMPLTRLAFTAIDRTPEHREAVAAEVARFAASDVVCYLAEAPRELAQRQESNWVPLLDWAAAALGVRLERTQGIVHINQPAEALDRVRALANDLDDFRLTGLASAAALFGSAVLSLAVERAEIDAEAAFELSRLDEAFQVERWGEDAEAAARADALRIEAASLGRWFAALPTPAA